MHSTEDYFKLASDFRESWSTLIALGDENRLHMLYTMMTAAKPEGLCVGDITAMTNLSRSTVSHHLRILKDAGNVLDQEMRIRMLRMKDSDVF